jgi:hypothetical protein
MEVVVSLMLQPLYPAGNRLQCPSERRLVWPPKASLDVVEKRRKILPLLGIELQTSSLYQEQWPCFCMTLDLEGYLKSSLYLYVSYVPQGGVGEE